MLTVFLAAGLLAAEKITVICNDWFEFSTRQHVPSSERLTIETRAEIAEKFRTKLINWQAEIARKKEELASAKLWTEEKSDADGTKTESGEAREGQIGETKH